jgi:hypothetical protein
MHSLSTVLPRFQPSTASISPQAMVERRRRMISPIQYAANRQNAAYSSGSRTPARKNKSNMNAEFRRFSEFMMESLAPAITVERELAQTICDSQWRINRILSIEDGMFAQTGCQRKLALFMRTPKSASKPIKSNVYQEQPDTLASLVLGSSGTGAPYDEMGTNPRLKIHDDRSLSRRGWRRANGSAVPAGSK